MTLLRFDSSVSASRGLSLVEALLSVALVASATAALLPALMQAARLHRDSDLQTSAAMMAAARLERLALATGLAPGGSLDTPLPGWHAWLDREGRAVDREAASFLCTWRVTGSDVAGADILTVRVLPLGSGDAAITLSTAVHHE